MDNALILLSQDPSAILGDGITGSEPVFDVALMKELASKELEKISGLNRQFDLQTEEGRKQLRAAIKPVKAIFADFEKNIKVVKKATSEIPKKCDAVSLALRNMSETAIAAAERPLKDLKEQEELAQKWWKKEGIPTELFALNSLIEQTESAELYPLSTAKEAEAKAAKAEEARKAAETALKQANAAPPPQTPSQPQNAPKTENAEHCKKVRRKAIGELAEFMEGYMRMRDQDRVTESETSFMAEQFAKTVYARNGASAWAFNYEVAL